ncbi:hypothetical protein [Halocynthiibacter styelae]|uniref:Uncharacterized protein n=1 Tax=Halocynthiibacter styelae TaxID=2761955 RepID=A0A8J7LPW9_9RHOB|nr:hypothetical protein [Paenihalocynthiibacter styelae]MBI1493412.1 hypothetical protein [Paenihalocynthiibacter styelae]
MSEEEIFCRRASLNEVALPPVETKVLKNREPDCFEHLPPIPKCCQQAACWMIALLTRLLPFSKDTPYVSPSPDPAQALRTEKT